MDQNNIELEEMRSQLTLLKDKLEKETILNDTLLRKATKTAVSSIQRQAIWLSILTIAFIPYCAWVFYDYGFSWWHIGFTILMLLFCVAVTVIQHHQFSKSDPMSSDMLQCAKSVKKLKNQYTEWLKVSIPLIIVWLSWTVIEGIMHSSGAQMIGFCVGVVMGGAIGGLIGNHLRKRMIRKCEDLISMIEG